jgi:thymidylate synthase
MYLFKPYDDALAEILEHGRPRTNQRTGVKTLAVFGLTKRYKLGLSHFPIMTKRKCWPKSVFAELLWFLSGSTSNDDLKALGCNFWTPWVDEAFEQKHGYAPGHFGPVYGFQLRHFGGYYGDGSGSPSAGEDLPLSPLYAGTDLYGNGGHDQLKWVVERIKEDPSCRRTLWTLWNPHDVDKMRLPPCHMLFQVMVDDDRHMTGLLYQRSADYPIGIPANIQFYSALTVMLAQQTDCTPHEFVHVTGDSHIYEDQIEAVREYLTLPAIDSPKLEIRKAPDIFSYKPEDFVISDFQTGPRLNIPVAV